MASALDDELFDSLAQAFNGELIHGEVLGIALPEMADDIKCAKDYVQQLSEPQ